jgi:hypothetical protein
MSEVVMILGESGSGKSSSIGKNEDLNIEGLNPNNTAIISTIDKSLPFKHWRKLYNRQNKNYQITRNPVSVIKALLNKKDNNNIKNVILDDFQYILSGRFIDDLGTGGNSFDKWNNIIKIVWDIINSAKSLRDDQIVYIISHVESYDEEGEMKYRMKAIGKGTHKYITPEGLVTICLYANTRLLGDKIEKYFITQSDGTNTAKSPQGMFPLEIPNDLGYIEKCIREYNGL